jgi:hypothetical protein
MEGGGENGSGSAATKLVYFDDMWKLQAPAVVLAMTKVRQNCGLLAMPSVSASTAVNFRLRFPCDRCSCAMWATSFKNHEPEYGREGF